MAPGAHENRGGLLICLCFLNRAFLGGENEANETWRGFYIVCFI